MKHFTSHANSVIPDFNVRTHKIYTERNLQTATRYFHIYHNIYYTYMAKIYTQYGKINYTEPVKILFS